MHRRFKHIQTYIKLTACFCLPWMIAVCEPGGQKLIPCTDKRIYYEGRVDVKKTGAVLYWAGSTIQILFNGTGLDVKLKDERGDNYYNVIIDSGDAFVIKPDTVTRLYTIASNLAPGNHSVTLFKRTQWDKGATWFYGIVLDKQGTLLQYASTKKRAIEFYGNSITCGSAVEDTSGGNNGSSAYENNYKSYAAITARHYNAAYHCIARSGIGLMVSWYPLIMPEMYNRLNPADAHSLWNFALFTPDVVVVNLLQNDSWIIQQPGNAQFKARFGTTPPTTAFIISSYKRFIQQLRHKYPNANIICALGSMDAVAPGSPWPSCIQQAIEQLHDKKTYSFFFPYKNTPGHPNANEQQQMADSLANFIDSHITW